MTRLEEIAESYIKLCFKIDAISPGYIDAYYGPEEVKTKKVSPVKDLIEESDSIVDTLENISGNKENMRVDFLKSQLNSIQVYLRKLTGEELSFEEESSGLYQADIPFRKNQYFLSIHEQLSKKLDIVEELFEFSFQGNLGERINSFFNMFTISGNELKEALVIAIDNARKKTKSHIELPENEEFTLNMVNGVPWKAYNWYKGEAESQIDVNETRDISLLELITFAVHEGYPGHHTFNSIFDMKYAQKNQWLEFSVYPLFSPMSVIMEGMARYAESFVFSNSEKQEFLLELSEELSLKNLQDPVLLKSYIQLSNLYERLDYGKINSAKMFYDDIPEQEIKEWIMKHELLNENDANNRIKFIDGYGTYITTYISGLELIRNKMDKLMQPSGSQWEAYKQLLETPPLISQFC